MSRAGRFNLLLNSFLIALQRYNFYFEIASNFKIVFALDVVKYIFDRKTSEKHYLCVQ